MARIAPGSQTDVAAVFGASDETSLPHEIGVVERALFTFGDNLYMHMVDFDRPVGEAMRTAQQLPAFRGISTALQPFIQAYDPDTWRSPQDAMAHCFYRWSAHDRTGAV